MTVRSHLGSSFTAHLDKQVLLRMVSTDNVKFQIGRDKYSYIYSPTRMKVNGEIIYKCCRASPYATSQTTRLFLCYDEDEHWVAVDAPQDSKTPASDGKAIWRSVDTKFDITSPGKVEWQWWDDKKEQWQEFTYPFDHKHITK